MSLTQEQNEIIVPPDHAAIALPSVADRVRGNRHGAGIGASHQTGWTAFLTDLIGRTAADARPQGTAGVFAEDHLG